MGYIDSGKSEGATLHHGGERVGTEGYFITPTIFTDTKPDMKIVQEEIFGPVCVVIKFHDDEDVLRQANDTVYGLAAAMFTKNIDRALKTSQKLRAGTTWVSFLPVCECREGRCTDEGKLCRLTAPTSFTLRFLSVATSSRVSDGSWESTLSSTIPPSRLCISTLDTLSKWALGGWYR